MHVLFFPSQLCASHHLLPVIHWVHCKPASLPFCCCCFKFIIEHCSSVSVWTHPVLHLLTPSRWTLFLSMCLNSPCSTPAYPIQMNTVPQYLNLPRSTPACPIQVLLQLWSPAAGFECSAPFHKEHWCAPAFKPSAPAVCLEQPSSVLWFWFSLCIFHMIMMMVENRSFFLSKPKVRAH